MTPWSRLRQKADACVAGYQHRIGATPVLHEVLLLCSVAERETACGDAWNSSHNWGAIQRRGMSAGEKDLAKQGATPPPSDPFEELHGDSSPITGKYQAWYWRFPEGVAWEGVTADTAGASKLCYVLLVERPQIKARFPEMGLPALSEAMYRSHYFEGSHDPRPAVGEIVPPGALTKGQQANVDDYAHALLDPFQRFSDALAGWTPGEAFDYLTEREEMSTVAGVQEALSLLGYYQSTIDNRRGPLTLRALQAFQKDARLPVTGIADRVTKQSIRAHVASLNVAKEA